MAGFYQESGKFACRNNCGKGFDSKKSMRIHAGQHCPNRPKKKLKNRAKKGQQYKDMD